MKYYLENRCEMEVEKQWKMITMNKKIYSNEMLIPCMYNMVWNGMKLRDFH